MTKFVIKEPKLIGRLLYFDPIKGCSVVPPLLLPFGSVTRLEGQRLTLHVVEGVTRVVAVPEKKGLPISEILPAVRWREKLTVAGAGQVEFEGWQLTSDIDRMRAMAIILRSHYLNPPSRGLILGCRFVNVRDQERVRKLFNRADRKDAWSLAWREKAGGMVACAVLDSLYHGKPEGRKELAEREGFDRLVAHWDQTSRSDIERALETLCIERITFDKTDGNCQGFARGSQIAINPVAQLPHKTLFHEMAHGLKIIVIFLTCDASNSLGKWLHSSAIRIHPTRPARYLKVSEIKLRNVVVLRHQR